MMRHRFARKAAQHRPARSLIAAAGVLLCTGGYADAQAGDRALYGMDDRMEVGEADEDLRRTAQSVAALFEDSALQALPGGRWQLPDAPIGDKLDWCPGERFADQPGEALCTAFLIGADRVATSAHCIRDSDDEFAQGLSCASARFVFDYRLDDRGRAQTRPGDDQIYRCNAVLAGETSRAGADWLVVELDRPVAEQRSPLPIYSGAPLAPDTELEVIGHPSGLPTKVGANGRLIEHRDEDFFVTDLDTYQGNSGSPVLARVAGQRVVVGLLSRGARDFDVRESQGGTCTASRLCTVEECGGEHASRLKHVANWASRRVGNGRR